MRSTYARTALFAAALMTIAPLARADDPAATAQAALDKGLAFLKANQQPDGGWQRSDREPIGISALVLRAFVDGGKDTSKTDFVAKGFAKLLSYQASDGGIYKNLLASYNTAICTGTLVAAKDPAFQPEIDKAVAYLKTLQWTQETRPEYVAPADKPQDKFNGKQAVASDTDPWAGGWGYGGRGHSPAGQGRPDLSNTQFAIEALKDSGVSPDDPAMKKALQFVTRCQNNSETNDQAWASNDGGFIYGPSDDRKGESDGGTFTENGQRRIRTIGSMSYAGLKSMVYAGLAKDDPRVKAVWAWVNKNFTLEENVGRAAADPADAKAGLFYGYLTMARALHAYGEPTLIDGDGKKIDWRLAMIDKLSSTQAADGSWVGIKQEMENNPILVTAYSTMVLEAAIADLKAHPAP